MKHIAAMLLSAALSTALAHTEVTVVRPSATVPVTSPAAVELRFSEMVNLRFCSFRVLRLNKGQTALAAASAALALKPDAPGLLNRGPRLGGMATHLTLALTPPLKSGTYVIAWAVLSDDGHPVTGHRTFTVK